MTTPFASLSKRAFLTKPSFVCCGLCNILQSISGQWPLHNSIPQVKCNLDRSGNLNAANVVIACWYVIIFLNMYSGSVFNCLILLFSSMFLWMSTGSKSEKSISELLSLCLWTVGLLNIVSSMGQPASSSSLCDASPRPSWATQFVTRRPTPTEIHINHMRVLVSDSITIIMREIKSWINIYQVKCTV